MTIQVEADEMLTILNNTKTTIDALIPVAEAAKRGVLETMNALPRAMELVHQAAKSTHSIIHQVRVRNEI